MGGRYCAECHRVLEADRRRMDNGEVAEATVCRALGRVMRKRGGKRGLSAETQRALEEMAAKVVAQLDAFNAGAEKGGK